MEFFSSWGIHPMLPAPILGAALRWPRSVPLPDRHPISSAPTWLPGLETLANSPPDSPPLGRRWGPPRKGKRAAPF